MPQNNPLQKYFRQPKVYMSLPSKGLYYGEQALQGDYTNVPVFGMTGMDEIIMKTPDALFNGEATVKVIESCCPYIKNAKEMPSIDVDAMLVAIRIATYGNEMDLRHICPACKTENEYTIDLQKVLDYFSSQSFDGKITVGDLTIVIKPLVYSQISKFNVENYQLQKMLYQLGQVESAGDEDKTQEITNGIYQRISDMQIELFLTSIDSIQTPDGPVTDGEMISEWMKNSDNEFFATIKTKLETNKAQWDMPKQHITCSNCQHESDVEVTMDQASFFLNS